MRLTEEMMSWIVRRKKKSKEAFSLLADMKKILSETVKDVVSWRLPTDTPSCIIWDKNDPSKRLQNIMSLVGQTAQERVLPILGVNTEHPLISRIEKTDNKEELCYTVLLMAFISEGILPPDPQRYLLQLNKVLSPGLEE